MSEGIPKVSLSAAQRARIRRLSQPKELSPDEEGGELNIVPFLDIIVNILIFVLATVAVVFTASIETEMPQAGGGVRSQVPSEALNLTVFIVNDGFALKAKGGNVAPGCESAGEGIAVPKQNGKYDYAALTRCAERLRASSPKFADEHQVYITANPGTEYQVTVSTISALLRDTRGQPMFENPNFQVEGSKGTR